jgi:hypothetical protein
LFPEACCDVIDINTLGITQLVAGSVIETRPDSDVLAWTLGRSHFVTEEAPGFGGMSLRKRDILIVMTVFTKFFSGFFALGFNQVVKLAMVVIVGDATGRFGGGLPEKGEDDDSDADQKEITFFKIKSH